MVLLAAACSDKTCFDVEPYCDGNVAHYCNGGGDKAIQWETQDCSGRTCLKGQCLSEPLVPCPKEMIGRDGCSPDGLHMGWCSGVGYWSWMFVCDPKLNAVCEERHVTDPNQDWLFVNCLLTSHEACTTQNSRTCHGDIKLECTNVGLWGWPHDCAAEGLVCRAGECVAAS